MCESLKILNKTRNGILTYCKISNIIQLVFNNLCFEFYKEEYSAFVGYINNLDADVIEKTYNYSIHDKKIPVSIGHVCFTILVNKEELGELKFLLSGKKKHLKNIYLKDIGYKFSRN